jgi:hypothetical protein
MGLFGSLLRFDLIVSNDSFASFTWKMLRYTTILGKLVVTWRTCRSI